MKNFRGSALAAGGGTPESVPHELLGSSLRFYLVFKHRNYIDKHLSRITRVTESFSARPRIIYKCDFSNMKELTLRNMKATEKGLSWLDYLYS